MNATLEGEYGRDPKVTREMAVQAAMLATQKGEAALDNMNVMDEDDNSLSKAIGFTQIAESYLQIARVLSPNGPYMTFNHDIRPCNN